MQILVTGANGQLGSSFKELSSVFSHIDFTFVDIADLDLTDKDQVLKYFASRSFDFLVNCAAYTAVDNAENEIQTAEAVNFLAVKNLSEALTAKQTRIIHISTDYVFDGNAHVPYKETDNTSPRTIYGKTKLKGENILKENVSESIIIRTAWLYSQYGKNFFLTMKERAQRGEKVKVVCDQKGSPTFAGDLALSIMQIIESGKFIPGIYHYTNEGECNWYEFAKEIYRNFSKNVDLVQPISTKEFPSKTERPLYSVLDKSKIKDTYNLQIPLWKESLGDMIRQNFKK